MALTMVKCPICGGSSQWDGNDFRPFCSERCQLIDFGHWADAEYGIPVEFAEISDADLEALEAAALTNMIDKGSPEN